MMSLCRKKPGSELAFYSQCVFFYGSLVNPLSAKVAKLRQGVKWVKMFKNNQTFD